MMKKRLDKPNPIRAGGLPLTLEPLLYPLQYNAFSIALTSFLI